MPEILDFGCGPGALTIDLAHISKGKLFAIDNYQPYLDDLAQKVIKNKLEGSINIINGDMHKLDFPGESFDLIWSEGAIYLMGLAKGLKALNPLLRTNGYIALTEITWLKKSPPLEVSAFWKRAYPAMTSIDNNIRIIEECGYSSAGHFILPEAAW